MKMKRNIASGKNGFSDAGNLPNREIEWQKRLGRTKYLSTKTSTERRETNICLT